MTYTLPGQEPQQPQPSPSVAEQPSATVPEPSSHSVPEVPSYATPQPSYGTPKYGDNQYAGFAAQTSKSGKRTFGMWSLIVGVSGLLLPPFVNNLAAVGLGIFGLLKENSKGMSIAGIATGGVGFIWGFVLWPAVATVVALAVVSLSSLVY